MGEAAAGQAQFDALVLGDHLVQVDDLGRLLVQGDAAELGLDRRVVHLHQEQHVGDDPRQPLQFLGIGLQGFAVCRAVAMLAEQHLVAHQQVADRRAQFVGQVVGELRELAYAILEAAEHVVEAAGQAVQFARQVLLGDAVGEILRADLGGHPAEAVQRFEAGTHHPPGGQCDQWQEEGQGQQGGAEETVEQALVGVALAAQQHLYRGAVLHAHGSADAQQALVVAGAPALEHRLAGIRLQAGEKRAVGRDAGRGLVAEAHQRLAAAAVENAQVQAAVRHQLVLQGMRLYGRVAAQVEIVFQAVADLLQLQLQVFPLAGFQLAAEVPVRHCAERQGQQRAEGADQQGQAQRQSAWWRHRRASRT